VVATPDRILVGAMSVTGGGEGRAVLVTGASRGIGAAVARAFAGAGDRVAVHYATSETRAHEVAASLPGSGHVVVGADLADPEAVRRMVDEAAGRLGGVDVLVNNAGVFVEHPITETTYQEWQRAWESTLAVNLVGAANVTWCVVQHMIRGAVGGSIVNVSSRGAFRGEPAHPAYGASKAAIVAFGQSLARALGPHGIAVTAVAPGFTETDMAAEALAGENGDRRRAESPLGRVATPGEVADAVLYLASRDAVMVSGAVLDLNGASYLRM
jgi:3-oxoacyl-[acyl-carrier protein] reductase